MFKNFHNSLNSLDKSISIQFTLQNSVLHLLSNFQNAITPQEMTENCNNVFFNALYFTMNVRYNCIRGLSPLR